MPRLRSIPRGPAAMLILGGAVLGLYVLSLIGSFVDGSFAGAHIGRNIRFGGTPMSGTPADAVDAEVAAAANGFADTPVEIDAGYGAVATTAADLGLTFDVGASARAVEAANETPLLMRPINWIASFFGARDVEPRYTVDDSTLNEALVGLDLPGVTEWKLPSLDADATGVRLEPGRAGSGIDTDRFAQSLRSAAEAGGVPLQLRPELVVVDPPITDEAVEEVAAAAEAATSAPLEVTVGEITGTIDVATLRSWLTLAIEEEEPDWDLDHDRVMDDLQEQFAEAGSGGVPVRWIVEEGEPTMLPGEPGTACCEDDSAARVLDALRSGDTSVELALRESGPERGREWAESLGIVEEVASFTTTHSCCRNRVVNIHLIADAVRGTVIEPGETLSINDHVGPRTAEKGYLPAGGITNGVLVDQLGGGVSQFTTTLFNAAFFAGLEYGEYQAHTIYFSRYPYGREATLSLPYGPDLEIHNPTPYGVLVWPTYTDTSITVTLYSTKHIEAEQTGQTESASGVCTLVRTERTRTWDDGRVEVDHVTARYRPEEGINCAGESTVPTTTTTTTTAPPTTAPPTTTTTAPSSTTPSSTTTTTAPGPTSSTTSTTLEPG